METLRTRIVIRLAAAQILLYACAACIAPDGETAKESPAGSSEPQPLVVERGPIEPGRPKAGQLSGTRQDAYSLKLRQGEFADLRLDQEEADLIAILADPEGPTILDVDFHLVGMTERLAFVAPKDGDYRVIVRLYYPSDEPRSYGLLLRTRGSPNSEGRNHAEALLSFDTAKRLQNKANHDHDEVLASYRKAEEGFAQSSAVVERAEALRRMGWEWSHLGNIDAEINSYSEASRLLLPIRPVDSAILLNHIGYAYRESGRTGKSFESHHKALDVLDSNPASDDRHQYAEAQSLNGLGLLHWTQGDPNQGLFYYREALRISKQIGARGTLADTLDNIGLIYGPIGLFDAAFDKFTEGLKVRVSLNDRSGQAATRTEIGWLHYRRGKTQEAIAEYQAALGLCGDGCPTRQGTLDRLGTAYRELGRFQDASLTYQESIQLARAKGRRRDEAHTLLNLCQLYEEWERLGEAEDHCSLAEQAFATIGDPTATAHSSFLRSLIKEKQGLLLESLGFARQAVRSVEQQREEFISSSLRVHLISSRSTYYRHYIELLMKLHSQDPGKEYDQMALAADQESRAQGLLDALSDSAPSDPRIAHRLKILQEQIAELQWKRVALDAGDWSTTTISELDRQFREMLQERDSLEYEVRRSMKPSRIERDLSLPLIQSELLDKDTTALVFALGERESYCWVLSRDSFRSVVLPRQQRIDELADEYRRLLERSYARSTRTRTRIVERELSDILLSPVAGHLHSRRLLIVADGALQTIPFATLLMPAGSKPEHASEERLGDAHELVFLPSIAILPAIRTRHRQKGSLPHNITLLADPVVNPSDDRLGGKRSDNSELKSDAWQASSLPEIATPLLFRLMPQAGPEADAIANLAGADRIRSYTGFDATRENALKRLADSRILHFAAHSYPTEQPDLSALVFSLFDRSGHLSPGFLWSLELQDLNVRADLVVLASCETALGSSVRREGVLGLGRSFLDAGARSVLVSLWRVDDEATTELMREFYRQLLIKGESPSESLRLAQIHLRAKKRWSAPAFWAGFVLQGDWQHDSFAYPSTPPTSREQCY